ncbi:MAG TPA: tetratricopeptide repeat protein [Pyrinomonadaceae bacterium]|nr:tetratricopeptide repeat protein [Pyrinomonadaceae bacterium]
MDQGAEKKMIEHPTKRELDGYRSRVLAPADFLSVHRHVSTCARCAVQCDSPADYARDVEDLHAALLEVPDDTPYHLSEAEVTAYARGTSNEIDLEIAESHLSVCETCLAEVQRHAPREVKTFKPRGLPFLNAWRVAAAVACGIIVIVLAIWLLRSKPVAPQEQVFNPANTSSPQSSPAAEAQPSREPDAELALVLNDGNRKVTVDKQGTLAGLERLPVPIQQRVRAALQAGKLEPSPALAQLASAPSTLLGESGNGLPFRLVGPVGEVVRSQQPTLRWRALAGAQSYTVTVTDADLNVVATSPPLNTTEWRISKPLKEGGIYSWQVTALKDGLKITSPVLPAPQAKFKVIDRSTAEMLQQARRAYPDSHLTLAVLYAEAGLVDEAEQELRAVVRDNPRAGIAQKLLRQVQAMR